MKRTVFKFTFLLSAVLLFTSCAILELGGYGNIGIGTSGLVKGQFRVQLIECLGNASSQSVTAVLTVTNTGPNSYQYIGGSLDGSFAIDSYGVTSKPYSSAGKPYDLPSGIMVRVEIPHIEPVRPGTPVFQSLTISIGTGKGNTVQFYNVPIVWSN